MTASNKSKEDKTVRGSVARWMAPDLVVSQEGHSEVLGPTEEKGSREVREARIPTSQDTERNKKGPVREQRRQIWLEGR